MTLSVNQEDLGNGRTELTITVSADQVDKTIRLLNIQMARPNGIVASTYGPDDLAMAIITKIGLERYQSTLDKQVTEYLAPFAVTQEKLSIIMEPQVKAGQTGVTPGQDYTFTATVTLKPQYELSSYGPVGLQVPAPAVSEAEIDEQLKLLAEDYATYEKDEARPLQMGDFILMNIQTVDYTGTEIPFLTAENMQYTVGEGYLPGGFDEQLVGLAVGAQKCLQIVLPDLASEPAADGLADWEEWEDWEEWALDDPERSTQVSVTVQVLERQKRILPEVDDLWVAQAFADCNCLLDLREKVRAAGLAARQNEVCELVRYAAAAELAKRFSGNIADDLLRFTRDGLLVQIEMGLLQQGRTLDDFIEQEGGGQEQFDRQLMGQVREILAQGFSLDALARHLGMSVEPADLDEAFRKMAPGQEKRVRQEFTDTGRMYMIYEDALRNKANQWLVDTATIEYLDADGRVVDVLAN